MHIDRFATSHFSRKGLLADTRMHRGKEREETAIMLSRIAAIEELGVHLDERYPSIFQFCVEDLAYSEQAAYKRITVARRTRQFPQILDMVADGRLHLTGLVVLSAHLTSGNADELLLATCHRTTKQIEQLIADRFPRPDLRERLEAIQGEPLSSRRVDAAGTSADSCPGAPAFELSSRRVETVYASGD